MQRLVGALCALALIGTACTNAEPGRSSEPTSGSAETTSSSNSDQVVAPPSTGEQFLSGDTDPALLETIPVDPDVRIGKLGNGMTYYLRFNDSPGGRAELRLVVDAGSVLEEEDQSGGAHFLEHMMFNGTERYPANDLIAVLERFGPQFGPDINAYTSFDETVYELSVPTDNPVILDEALEVLVQWAAHATLAQDDVEGERGVVVEEWRVRDQGLSGRISAAFGDLILTGTPYEGRLPIGEFESISAMDPEPLRRFYQDWYRPDLMAVVVVGDIDVDDLEATLGERFGSVRSPASPRPRPQFSVVPPTAARVATLSDPEATAPSVDLFYAIDGSATAKTVGDLQRIVALAIAMEMLANRLSEDALRGTVPFFSSDVFDFAYTRAIAGHGISVSTNHDRLQASTRSILTEVARARQFGFSDAEFERVRDLYVAVNEQVQEGQESRQDSQFAADYVEHFLSGAPIPSVDQLFAIQTGILGRLTLDDAQRAFQGLVTESAPSILVVGPDQPAAAVPTDDELLAMIDEIAETTLEPRPEDGPVADQLMEAPEPAVPISVVVNDPFGILEIDYANGARVLFWQTDIADNVVSFSASSFGGFSQVEVGDITEIELGIEIIPRSGLGDLDQVAVGRVLSDQIVELAPYIDQTHEGLIGSAATEDLETLFQLIHLSLARPRIDEVAVMSTLTEKRPFVESPEDVPRLLADIALNEAYYGPDDQRHRVLPTLEDFDSFDSDRAFEVYLERFGSAGEFLFVFVGDASGDTIVDLADRYIGTLPGSPGHEGFIDHQPLPRGEQIFTVEAGQDDQGLVQFTFTNFVSEQDAFSDVVADLLELIGNNRLRDRIRERLSASYAPFMIVDMQLEPDPYVETYISVSGDPDRLDEIAAEVLADVADLRTAGPTPGQLQTAQEQLLREYELINNPFLLERLIFFEEHEGRELSEIVARYDIVPTVTVADIAALAALAFPVGSYIEVKLIPAP